MVRISWVALVYNYITAILDSPRMLHVKSSQSELWKIQKSDKEHLSHWPLFISVRNLGSQRRCVGHVFTFIFEGNLKSPK